MQNQGTQGVKYPNVLQAGCNTCIWQEHKTCSWSLFPLPFQPRDLQETYHFENYFLVWDLLSFKCTYCYYIL